jgi:hypothetical protein
MNLQLLRLVAAMKKASEWTPAALFASGEQGAWYDPSDFSTMFQDTAGTVPVTAVGQSVARINDKSGRGNHATQATTAARPLLEQDAGGRYYLRFDGVDDGMATSSINFTATDKMTLLAGVLSSSTAASGCIFALSSTPFSTPGGARHFVNNNAGGTYTPGAVMSALRGTGERGIFVQSVTGAFVSSSIYDGALVDNETTLRINTVPATSTATDSGLTAFANQPIYIGSLLTGTRLNGRIYSLIVRGAASNTDQITAAETWVNGKTGAY